MTNVTASHSWAPGPVSEAVATFGADYSWHEASSEVKHAVITVLTEVLLRTRLGSESSISKKLGDYVKGLFSPAQATVVFAGGMSFRAAAAHAALVNAASASVTTRDLAAAVVPAALSASEFVDAEGETLCDAILVGLEIALRTADGLGKRHRDRGWDLVGTAGRIGASVASSRVFGLPMASIVDAIGYAATATAGVRQPAASSVLAVGAGKAAADGIESALYARAGLIGPSSPLEGRRAMFALEAGEDPERIVRDIGHNWMMIELVREMTPPENALQSAMTIITDHADKGVRRLIETVT